MQPDVVDVCDFLLSTLRSTHKRTYTSIHTHVFSSAVWLLLFLSLALHFASLKPHSPLSLILLLLLLFLATADVTMVSQRVTNSGLIELYYSWWWWLDTNLLPSLWCGCCIWTTKPSGLWHYLPLLCESVAVTLRVFGCFYGITLTSNGEQQTSIHQYACV